MPSCFRLPRVAVLAILTLVAAGTLYSQIRSASITGTVTDASGATIPDVQVVVVNEETGIEQTVNTGASGIYSVPYLPAGRYRVSASKTGFTPYSQKDIVLNTGQTVRSDITLQVGAVSAAVEVQASAVMLQTENATVQNMVNEQVIKAIPNITHNPMFYAALQPGVVGRSSFNDTTNVNSFGIGADGRRFFSALSVNGAEAFSSDVQVDGLSVQGSAWNEAAIIPNQEGLQEVRTVTNSYSAEYGRGAGLIQLSTRSGSNEFHGSAVYRLRNEAFNANSFSNNARGLPRTPFKVNSYTGSFGGPIIKNKFFFFASYEGLQHNRSLDFFRTVPTEAERAGDFSKTVVNVSGAVANVRLYNPLSARLIGPNVYQRDPVPNADLRTVPGLLDQNMLRLFSYYPKPNRPAEDVFGTNNYFARRAQSFERNSVNSRVDYKLGQHSLYGAFGVNRGAITTPGAWGDESPFFARGDFIGATNEDDNPYGQVGLTLIVTPSIVADLRYGITRIFTQNAAYSPGTNFDFGQFGVPAEIQALTALPYAPPDYRGGNNLSPLSNTGSLYKQEGQTNHNLNASATWIRGRWTHKFGTEGRVFLSNYNDPEYSMLLSFNGNATREYVNAFGGGVTPGGVVIDASNSGWSPAAALMGVGRIQISGARNPLPAFAQKYFALYSQNDWKATDRLTVQLGLRWDLQPGLTDRFDRVRSIDLTRKNTYGMMGEWAFPGVNGASRNLYDTEYNNWGPRIGLAYRLGDSTVIRTGYGLTYLPSNTGFFATGGFYGMDSFAASTLNDDAVIYGSNPSGVPVGRFNRVNVIVPAVGADKDRPELYGNSNFAYFPRTGYRNSYLQQWNLTVERRLGPSSLVSAGYVASRGLHLPFARMPVSSNQYLPESLIAQCRADYINRNGTNSLCSDPVPNPWQRPGQPLIPFSGNLRNATIPLSTTLQPYPGLAGSGLSVTPGWSNYHSLQMTFQRSMSNGLQVSANYVWSKSMAFAASEAQANGFADGVGYSGAIDLLNLRNNYALSSTDIPHRLTLTTLYQMPFGKGSLATGNAVVNAIIRGWSASGLVVAQSGTPIQISGANSGALNSRPNRIPGQPVEVPQELQRWYDSPNTADRTVTLPSGRRMVVCRYCFLKFNPDAFAGQTIRLANGSYVADPFWWGSSAPTMADIRNPSMVNFNLGVDRTIAVTERVRLEFSAQATNVLNQTQFRPAYNGGLGGTQIRDDRANGFIPGLGTNDSYGTIGLSTFDPRQIEFQMRIRF